ncbi:MAG: hypothetical protein NUW01_12920 [Gemmatimonadaceae bacterium]|nr:hypothetical protein [Gemmatimonadaceae bacterium]
MAGTFSYAGTASGDITTARDKVRLEVGDTDSGAVLFYDDEIDVYLNSRADNVLLTAADLCDAAATRYARRFSFSTDGQKFDLAAVTKAFQDRARQLRARARGVQTVEATRVDGYSDDVGNQDVGENATNPRQNFYVVGGVDRLP